MQIPPLKNQLELKKHTNAIHCSNNLSLVQRKLFNALLFFAYSELSKQLKFDISVKTLCNLIGFNSRNYIFLKEALYGLTSIAIEWDVIEQSSSSSKPIEAWQTSSMLASARLKGGICTYEYSGAMRELLFQPETYGRLHIPTISKFTSSYGLALYENCTRYQNLPQTPWFPIAVFRKLMGVSDDKYASFNNFKRRVLNIAIEEVNKYSQIHIVPEFERHGKQVIKIRFKLVTKQNIALAMAVYDEDNSLIDLLIKDFGFSIKTANQLTEKYGIDYIQEKIALIMSSKPFQMGKIKALSGYLMDALEKDYKDIRSSANLLQEKRLQKEERERTKQKNHEEQRNKQLLYEKYKNDQVDNFIYSQLPQYRDQIIKDFEEYLINENPIIFRIYSKYALEDGATRAYFNGFVTKIMIGQGVEIIEYADFIENVAE